MKFSINQRHSNFLIEAPKSEQIKLSSSGMSVCFYSTRLKSLQFPCPWKPIMIWSLEIWIVRYAVDHQKKSVRFCANEKPNLGVVQNLAVTCHICHMIANYYKLVNDNVCFASLQKKVWNLESWWQKSCDQALKWVVVIFFPNWKTWRTSHLPSPLCCLLNRWSHVMLMQGMLLHVTGAPGATSW